MNIQEVFKLPIGTKIKDKKYDGSYIVEGDTGTKIIVDISSRKALGDLFTLQSIINMDFEVIDERPKYNFYNVLHLNQEVCPLGVKVNLKYVIESYEINNFTRLAALGIGKEEAIDNFFCIKEAVTILSYLLDDDNFEDVLLNNENFIIKENE